MTTNLLSVIEQLVLDAEILLANIRRDAPQLSGRAMGRMEAALAAGKQALEQTQGDACKYADMFNEEGECTSGCFDRKNAQPVAYVVFASNGNIRIWGHAPDDVTRIKAEFGSSLIPLYTLPQAAAKVVQEREVERMGRQILSDTDAFIHVRDQRDTLRAELAAIRAQEPVGNFLRDFGEEGMWLCCKNEIKGMTEPLFAAPVASPDVGALVDAVDSVLERAPCDCSHKRRYEDGEHLSGCHLFDLNIARAALTQSQADWVAMLASSPKIGGI